MKSPRVFLSALFESYLENHKGYVEIRTISPDGKAQSHFFNSLDEIVKQVPSFEGNHIYFGVCPRDVQSGKKENVSFATTLWCDLDYGKEGHKKESKWQTEDEALKAINDFEFPPSIIIHSGHGLYGFWLLKEPTKIEDISYVEGIIKGITEYVGGDPGTQNIDRILRLPGTNNIKIPDKPKEVRILKFEPTLTYEISDLENYKIKVEPLIAPEIDFDAEAQIISIPDLPLKSDIKELIYLGNKIKHKFPSRSERDQAVVGALVHANVTDSQIKAIFSNPAYGISDKYLERKQYKDNYLRITIQKARASYAEWKKEHPKPDLDTLLGILRKGEYGYEIYNPGKNKRPATWTPVSNFTIDYNKVIKSENVTNVVGALRVEQDKLIPFIWDSKVPTNPQILKEELGRICPTGLKFMPQHISRIGIAINANNENAREYIGVDSIGQNKNTFLTPSCVIKNGKIEKNEKYYITNKNISIYDFVQKPLEDCKKAVDFILDVILPFHSYNVTLPLLGEIGRVPLIHKISDLLYVTFLRGPTGAGKCFSSGTPILMHDGTIKKIEDVKVGDLVMGDDSTPRKVLNITSGTDTMYKIIPTKGDSYTVNSEHILSLKKTGDNSHGKYKPKGQIIDLSIKDYLKRSKYFKHLYKGYRVPVDWLEKKVDLDPYLLGLWLGDGTTLQPNITTADKEIINYLFEIAKKMNLKITKDKPKSKATTYKFVKHIRNSHQKNIFAILLEKYNVLGNKHIPYIYKTNSQNIRLQVLAGLLDSDGYLGKKSKNYDYITKLKCLADDMLFLCRSLGFAAYLKEKIVKGKTYYRLSINGDYSLIPNKIKRKQGLKRKQKKDVLVTGIKVKNIGKGEYYGFSTDGNQRFLLGDFTVTHNSVLGKIMMNFYANIGITTDKEQSQGIKNFRDTMNHIEKHGYHLMNLPMMLDDFKYGVRGSNAMAIKLIQGYYNQGGRGRLTQRIEERDAYYLRCNLWMTGENLPEGEQSVMERILIYQVNQREMNLSKIKHIDQNRHLLRIFTPHYIAWTQVHGPQIFETQIKHPRLGSYIQQNLTGLKTILSFMLYNKWIVPEKFEELLELGIKATNMAFDYTEASATSENIVENFLNDIRELVSSKSCIINSRNDFPDEDKRDSYKPIIGEYSEDGTKVYILPNKTIQEACRQLHHSERKYTAKTLGIDLKEAGCLAETEDKRISVRKRLKYGGNTSVWVFDKERLMEDNFEPAQEKREEVAEQKAKEILEEEKEHVADGLFE